jgi:phosphoribosylformimino-5-aminoimidazole carboxamide ribotide isomerase
VARLIPVIDVMGGRVVRAVGGRRSEYRPLPGESEPVAVARKLLDATGTTELYVADLDTITGTPQILSPNLPAVERLARLGRLWIDYGHRSDFDEADHAAAACGMRGNWELHDLFEADVGLVIGSETAEGFGTLVHTMTLHAPGPVVVSVDLHAGELRCNRDGWGLEPDAPPEELVHEVVSWGVNQVLVLDTAAVGTDTGPVVGPLVRRVRDRFPTLELWAGGGVRDRDDVRRLEDAGADAVLVASALHAGTLP